jgi:hypothetical protein
MKIRFNYFVANNLPTYMIPVKFFYFKKFPVTGNQGKINRPEIINKIKV